MPFLYCTPSVFSPRASGWSGFVPERLALARPRWVGAWCPCARCGFFLGSPSLRWLSFPPSPSPPFALPFFPFPPHASISRSYPTHAFLSSNANSNQLSNLRSSCAVVLHAHKLLPPFNALHAVHAERLSYKWVSQLLASLPLRIFRFQSPISSCTELP